MFIVNHIQPIFGGVINSIQFNTSSNHLHVQMFTMQTSPIQMFMSRILWACWNHWLQWFQICCLGVFFMPKITNSICTELSSCGKIAKAAVSTYLRLANVNSDTRTTTTKKHNAHCDTIVFWGFMGQISSYLIWQRNTSHASFICINGKN